MICASKITYRHRFYRVLEAVSWVYMSCHVMSCQMTFDLVRVPDNNDVMRCSAMLICPATTRPLRSPPPDLFSPIFFMSSRHHLYLHLFFHPHFRSWGVQCNTLHRIQDVSSIRMTWLISTSRHEYVFHFLSPLILSFLFSSLFKLFSCKTVQCVTFQ